MSRASSELERAIIKEGGQTGFWNKLQFWKGVQQPQFVGADEPTRSLAETLASTTPLSRAVDHTAGVLAAIGHEFVWGKKPPTDIRRISENIQAKKLRGEPLSPEEAWLDGIRGLDTDMF